jgi:hypothetical protein
VVYLVLDNIFNIQKEIMSKANKVLDGKLVKLTE